VYKRQAYAGFAVGILLWGWHETMFLLGYISGPRKSPCPPALPFWSRFRASAETVIHHELAIAFHAAIIMILTAGAENRIAAWTFLLLWGMRISSKLIIFSGAPNISDALLPRHLEYLKSYFMKRAATPFFSVAMTLVASATAALIYHASLAPLGSFQSAGLILVSALAALAVLEHLALVAPLPDQALWGWALPRAEGPDQFDRTDSRWRR
jgi:putative photosynthetic complex assembly protein 2